jgi:hypothetical protein
LKLFAVFVKVFLNLLLQFNSFHGIRHTLLNFPLGNLKTTNLFLRPLVKISHYFVLLHSMNATVCFVSLQSGHKNVLLFSIYTFRKDPLADEAKKFLKM